MKPSGDSIGKLTPDNLHTRKQAAHLVGRSVDTLKRWQKIGACVPSESMKAGSITVWLYTDEDIRKLIERAKTQRPGRKKKGVM